MTRELNARPQLDEAALRENYLVVLRLGIQLQKPDAVDRVKREIAKLDSAMSAKVNRREFVLREVQGQQARADKLTQEIAADAAAMKQLAQMLRGVKRVLLDVDDGATPEAKAKGSNYADPVQSLFEDEKLDDQQARAANAIARIYRATTSALNASSARIGGHGTGVSRYDDLPGMTDRSDQERHIRFLPWAEHLRHHNPITLDIVLRVVVFRVSLSAVAKHHRIGWSSALAKLRDGLDQYWKVHGAAPPAPPPIAKDA